MHAADVGPGLTVNGETDFLSDQLDENQREITHFAALSLQHSAGALTMQTSLIARYSSLDFSPDPQLGDLLFNGISQHAYKRDVAYGAAERWRLPAQRRPHAARRPVRADRPPHQQHHLAGAAPTADGPADHRRADRHPRRQRPTRQWIESVYLQDEWRLDGALTVNYGLRFDQYTAFSSGSQLSPRVNFVWQAAANTTVHAGYSRFFSPPPFELVGATTIDKFANTTAAPAVPLDDAVQARALQLLRPRACSRR